MPLGSAAWLVQVTGSAACQSKNFLLLRYLKSLIYNSVAELRKTNKNENLGVCEMSLAEQRDCNAGAAVVNYRGGNALIYACYAVHNAFT